MFCYWCTLCDMVLYEIVWHINYPDSKIHGANMGPIWGRQDPNGPQVHLHAVSVNSHSAYFAFMFGRVLQKIGKKLVFKLHTITHLKRSHQLIYKIVHPKCTQNWKPSIENIYCHLSLPVDYPFKTFDISHAEAPWFHPMGNWYWHFKYWTLGRDLHGKSS